MYDPSSIGDFYDAYGHRERDRFEATPVDFPVLCCQDVVEPVVSDPGRGRQFLEWEVAACREPGTIDGASSIIAVVQRATSLR